jgi:hypothetical protein
MTINSFNRSCGVALFLGGFLTILINVIVTPLMFNDHTSIVHEATTIFLLRQSASDIAALLLLFGCLGVYLAQIEASGAFRAAAFIVSFVGGCSAGKYRGQQRRILPLDPIGDRTEYSSLNI